MCLKASKTCCTFILLGSSGPHLEIVVMCMNHVCCGFGYWDESRVLDRGQADAGCGSPGPSTGTLPSDRTRAHRDAKQTVVRALAARPGHPEGMGRV